MGDNGGKVTKTGRRIWILVVLAMCAGAVGGYKVYVDRLKYEEGRSGGSFTLIEPGLYMGANGEKPPDATAVLSLTFIEDRYTAEVYKWQPIYDAAPAPSIDWLREQVAFVDVQRRAGRTVFVHCDAGVSRSGMVVVAYFMWREKWSLEKSLAFVKFKRPMVNPNRTFMELLREWEKMPATAPAAG